MQLFPCPFCGPRDETEFQFGAEAGKTRPEPAPDVDPGRWSAYLYGKKNPKGPAREIWVHLTCGEYFLMERDTATHVVAGSRSLRKDGS
ncbi:MAG: sarcosine oxidase subunit delta [Rhizobiaceae bacterium]